MTEVLSESGLGLGLSRVWSGKENQPAGRNYSGRVLVRSRPPLGCTATPDPLVKVHPRHGGLRRPAHAP